SIYLDTGRPVPGQHRATIENLKVVKPTTYVGSPLGWAMLAEALEADHDLARTFFSNVRSMASGSAAMPMALAERIADLTEKYMGGRVILSSTLKSTEVSLGLARFWPVSSPEVIGLPEPGAAIKLVPLDDERFELRVLSAATTPGYLNAPEKTAESFDEDGFFRMGDAVKWFDSSDPDEGLVFAGRVAEQFKLQSGTWVSAGSLRAEVVTATSPYVRDAVVCGLNQRYVALLLWPNVEKCDALGSQDAVRDVIAAGLRHHNEANPGSSQRIDRFLLLGSPPDAGANEITDKGYINQGAAQTHRADDIERLYASDPDPAVITVEQR
ncbi:MAG: AMP-binding protein, partial [Actinomycetota bacterium]|nr:AMP-binding protein [Actinomycetota bacterium]